MIERIVLSAVVLASCNLAWGRIGETEEQITKRYGKSIGDIPAQTFGPVRGFALPGFVVGVKFVNGLSAMEMISKNDQTELSPAEIQTLLKKHGAESWKIDRFDQPNWKRWRTEDGSLVAVYDEQRHFLYVNSRQFYEQQAERTHKPEPEKPKS